MPTFASSPNPLPATETPAGCGRLVSFTAQPQPGEKISELCQRVAWQLREASAKPLHLLVFGDVASASVVAGEILGEGPDTCPITWAEGSACSRQPLAGIQVHAFTGDVERIKHNGQVVGSVFTEGGAQQCLIGGLTATDKSLSRGGQTSQTIENLQKILSGAGFELTDTIRTWFYLENILSWYDEFNHARTEIYSQIKFKTGSLPASTGVGAKNPAGTALVLTAWAYRPLVYGSQASEVASPLQCPAPAYGSSFSRAMEVVSANNRRLFISGTASIAPGGKTQWIGNVRRQVELTMDVVESILRSRELSFDDLTRATAYFRNTTDGSVFQEWLAANRLTQLPVVSAQCDVCRDDLLFELEAEAEENR